MCCSCGRDDAGTQKSIPFSFVNEPLEHRWSTYEEAVLSSESYHEGFGPEYQVPEACSRLILFDLSRSCMCEGGHVDMP
jgi:hypothetical protein